MSLVMKKYRYNHKDYLVYERNLLAREFDANEWQTICNNDLGVGVDFIIEIIKYNFKGFGQLNNFIFKISVIYTFNFVFRRTISPATITKKRILKIQIYTHEKII